jgi:AcrR family transcriptional regulator
MKDDVKRGYRSPLREETARLTRARIRDAAAVLFAEQGYVSTSVLQIAQQAEVAVRTVFVAFPGGKAQLFDEALDVALGGDDSLVHLAHRETTFSALDEADLHDVVPLLVKFTSDLYDRAGPLIAAYHESAGGDPHMRRHADLGAAQAAKIMLTIARRLHERDLLRPGLSPQLARDLLVALCSPQLHRLLRHDRRWTSQRYRDWLTATLTASVCRASDTPTF